MESLKILQEMCPIYIALAFGVGTLLYQNPYKFMPRLKYRMFSNRTYLLIEPPSPRFSSQRYCGAWLSNYMTFE